MKRTIVTLALVTAFVFAFAAVAQATFRGFTPIRSQAELDQGMLSNFITFAEALEEMERNDVNGALQETAHGGYVTTTTKCATCHSAHAAPAVNPGAREGDSATGNTATSVNRANNTAQAFLTAGADGCEACHVSTGAQSSRLLVEWGPGGGGPHAAPNRGCVLCHNAGIHGLASSDFHVMNVFLLGSGRNQQLAGSDTAVAADRPAGTTMNRDAQIRQEVEQGRILRGGVLDIPPGSSFRELNAAGAPIAGSSRAPVLATASGPTTWWYDGSGGLGPIGHTPPVLNADGDLQGTGASQGGVPYGAARSLATAFTCGESGCHDSTAMFNLNWGMGFDRINYVRDADPTFAFGSYQYGSSIEGTRTVTGHVMPSIRVAGSATQACGPCHGGNPAGFPTASSTRPEIFGDPTAITARDNSRLAYGCDQCHDMVGVATNSTAWPHGNRNILVYEWDADGYQHENVAAAGNLWMYGGNIARAIGAPGGDGNNTGLIQAQQFFRGPNSVNPNFADQSWTVLTGVTSGRYGVPGDDPTAVIPGYVPNRATVTGLLDGSCLKCHVPLDATSMAAMGAMGADALRHAWRGGGGALNPTWDGTVRTNADRLFLYR